MRNAIFCTLVCIATGFTSAEATDPMQLFSIPLDADDEQTEGEATDELFDFPISRALGVDIHAEPKKDTDYPWSYMLLADKD